jgi:hypothetical protein
MNDLGNCNQGIEIHAGKAKKLLIELGTGRIPCVVARHQAFAVCNFTPKRPHQQWIAEKIQCRCGRKRVVHENEHDSKAMGESNSGGVQTHSIGSSH